jgi:hypothetical protein
MSDKVTIFAKVTMDIRLHDVYVEDGQSREAVQAKLDQVLNDHLGVHDYTFGPRFEVEDSRYEVEDWEQL